MVVKLDDNNGALDAELEGIGVPEGPDPAKVYLVEPRPGVVEAHPPRPRGQVQQVLAQDAQHELLLAGRYVGHDNALVRHDPVVAVCAAEVALVVVVPPAVGHGRVPQQPVCLRPGLLVGREALHKPQPQPLLLGENAYPAILALIDKVGLGACKPQQYNNLRLIKEDVEVEVVAVEGVAPGARGRGVAKQDEVVAVLVYDGRRFDQVAEEAVDAYCAQRLLVALGRQRRLEDAQDAAL